MNLDDFMTDAETERFTGWLMIAGAALELAGDMDKAQRTADVLAGPDALVHGLSPRQGSNAAEWAELITHAEGFLAVYHRDQGAEGIAFRAQLAGILKQALEGVGFAT